MSPPFVIIPIRGHAQGLFRRNPSPISLTLPSRSDYSTFGYVRNRRFVWQGRGSFSTRRHRKTKIVLRSDKRRTGRRGMVNSVWGWLGCALWKESDPNNPLWEPRSALAKASPTRDTGGALRGAHLSLRRARLSCRRHSGFPLSEGDYEATKNYARQFQIRSP